MAGMLPGVECARRRRFHQSITSSDSPYTAAKLESTRRSSFCLYSSNHYFQFQHSSSSSQQRSNTTNQAAYQNEKLGEIAREAKERLDEKLRTHRKPETTAAAAAAAIRKKKEEEEEVTKKSEKKEKKINNNNNNGGGKRVMNWGKLGLNWKASEQEECSVCLEKLKGDNGLVNLPCAHKFHSRCLVPWLENNAHCPCCRMSLPSSQ